MGKDKVFETIVLSVWTPSDQVICAKSIHTTVISVFVLIEIDAFLVFIYQLLSDILDIDLKRKSE